MKTNNNISKRAYQIVGFENGIFFNITLSIGELLSNSSNDTELLYTIQELYIDSIISLGINETLCIKSGRDMDFESCVVCRVS